MTLVEALRCLNQRAKDSTRSCFALACGFTPLHFKTFLAAQIAKRTTSGRIDVEVGLFGDLPGTLQRLIQGPAVEAAVPLEWSDLDARLGFRGAKDWRADCLTDILSSV
ncbi:MAG TPA: hypothetical protein VK137_08350, partial [Planctomycetaceae bacterium]|nr:hypothetical protein [Planctomycetaceae bacterium]